MFAPSDPVTLSFRYSALDPGGRADVAEVVVHVLDASRANTPPNAPDLSKMKLVQYDFVKYGSAAERRRLLDRWDREVGALPR